MLLVADVGNTHTVLGLWDEKSRQIVEKWRVGTNHVSTEDELMVHVVHFLATAKHELKEIDGFCVASVVPQFNRVIEYFSKKYLDSPPFFVKSENVDWIEWNVLTPQDMGADRVADVVAAVEEYEKDVIVVDFGTAITLEVFTDKYEGGAILTGTRTALKSLFSSAAKLPTIQMNFPDSPVGKDTQSNIQAGVVLGTVLAVDGLIELYEEHFLRTFTVISTGGEGKELHKRSKKIEVYDETLTLKGISFCWERMKNEGSPR